MRIVLAETEHEATLSDILRAQRQYNCARTRDWPRRRLDSDELQTFKQSNWLAASLGNTILRAETAAIAALAVARAEV